ncbi:MAG TPA: hypothetical protein VGE24_13375, partial [Emticicia sp.]
YSIFLPPGIYYFDKSIHIFQKIELFGTGKTQFGGGSFQSIIQFTEIDCSFIVHGEYCFNGGGYINERKSSLPIANWLEMFPDDTSVTHDTNAIEGYPENYMGNSCNGGFSIIRDIQIWGIFQPHVNWNDPNELSINLDPTHPRRILMYTQSPDNAGIKLISAALLFRVQISQFAGTGLEIDSETKSIGIKEIKRINNADSWLAESCIITGCGGHGIHTFGRDSQAGMCKGLRTVNIMGNGIYESSFFGNSYYSCYIYYSLGHGIRADAQNGYSTVFYSCMLEHSSPNWVRMPAMVIGGNDSGSSPFIDESMFHSTDTLNDIIIDGHIGLFNRGQRNMYKVSTPFQIKNILKDITLYLQNDQSEHENSALGWKSENEDNGTTFWWLKYWAESKIWNIGKSKDSGLYFTTNGHVRQGGYAGVGGLLLGSYNQPVRIESGSSARPELSQGFNLRGDIKFNNSPTVGGYAGWIMAEKNGAINWFPFGKIEDFTSDSETPTNGLRNNNGNLELLVDRQVIGSIDVDGGGWILTKKGFKPIPPWNPLFDVFTSDMNSLAKELNENIQKKIQLKLIETLREIGSKL